MNLLDLFVKVGVKDEASGAVGDLSDNIIGKLGGAAKKAATALAGAFAVQKVVEFGKAAVDSYAQYEQLEGGINKLFGTGGQTIEQYAASVGQSVEEVAGKYDSLNQAHDIVMANAQKAYATAGMSANQYMEQVTGFAAALTNSLGGDTVEAAHLANEAMIAISDNVNTFGSDMGSVQYAFQGFAKQNYTMLDNLKLGYGGTKTEMERLIQDASQMTKEQEDLNLKVDAGSMSFDNIVKAIQVVQKHQGIYGTTAREAANTIEGSINMTKAAWANWVTELGKDNADMQARTKELVESLTAAAQNVSKRVVVIAGTLIESLPTVLVQLGSTLLPEVAKIGASLLTAIGGIINELFGTVLPQAAEALSNMFANIDIATAMEELRVKIEEGITALAAWLQENGPLLLDLTGMIFAKIQEVATLIMENIPFIMESIAAVLMAIGQTLLENAPTFLQQAGEFFANIIQAIGDNAPKWIQTFSEKVRELTDMLIKNAPAILQAAAQFFGRVLQALLENAPKILGALLGLLMDLIGYVLTHIPEILAAAVQFFGAILGALVSAIPSLLSGVAGMIGEVIGHIAGAVGSMLNAAAQWFGGLLQGAQNKAGELVDWVAGIPDRILGALGDLGSLLWNAGSSILNGLWDGMESVWNDMTGWISGIADQIASLKGPLPYDKKVLIENGQALMHGLRGGMKESFENDVIPYVSSMADRMSDAFGDADFSSNLTATTAKATATPAAPNITFIIKDTVIEKEADVDKVLERAESIIRRRTGGAVSWSTSPSMA